MAHCPTFWYGILLAVLVPDSGPSFGTGFRSQKWEHRIPDSGIDALRALAGELLLTSRSPISGCGITDHGFGFPVPQSWVRTVDSGFRSPNRGSRTPDSGSGFPSPDPRLRTPDSGCRIPESGFAALRAVAAECRLSIIDSMIDYQ